MSVEERPHRVVTRRRALALLALVGALVLPLLWVPAAQAGAIDTNWTARRVGVNLPGPGDTLTSTPGDTAAATMTYNVDHAGGQQREWDFTAVASESSADGPIRVPYTWQGLHAWFNVTAHLDMIVNGETVGILVDAGPYDCCTTPSNGFIYGGVAEFNVKPGDTYGFRLAGHNNDSNDFLRGTFTLSTKPYVDATLGSDNRQWVGATTLADGGLDGKIVESGEARWYKIPVVPNQRVSVDLSSLPADYDVALYGDIGQAFDRLSADPNSQQSLTELSAGQSSAAVAGSTQTPQYDDLVTAIPKTAADIVNGASFAPRVYSPRVYSPRVYSPRVYSPRVYSPEAYDPTLSGNQAFADAFSGAQVQTLLAVSANTGTGPEAVSARSGNTQGYFYVRVQGHDDAAFSATDSFHVVADVTGGEACQGLSTFDDLGNIGPTHSNPTTIVVTDSNRIPYASNDPADTPQRYLASLHSLADASDGRVIDVAESPLVQALFTQARAKPDCPYAMNLVANAIKDVVDGERGSSTRYIVLAGNDDAVPFFRYPDLSGLGSEKDFTGDSGVIDNNPSRGSLANDQVLSQDAYGARTTVLVGGSSIPIPDLAVGRLVETAQEIEGTVEHFVDPGTSTVKDLPRPTSSLVTGYDFLADAAHAVDDEFSAALGPDHAADADTLISEMGTAPGASWSATDLSDRLLGSRHDLLYLAGHFSPYDTLAADFATTFDAAELDPGASAGEPLPLEDTLVLSAGCHSGYNTLDNVAGANIPPDWAQRMAEQHAVLIGGTGYQYGDTDFLEYSERLYLQVARELRKGTGSVAIGSALVQAKQDYLAGLATLSGIDEKAVLEATMYGLPMTGIDVAGRTTGDGSGGSASPSPADSGPGATLGLSTEDRSITTRLTSHSKVSNAGAGLPATLDWYEGRDGVTVNPGDPALPKQVVDVTAPNHVLRGVGFRGGAYTQSSGVLPLTGAPAVEGSTPHTNFLSDSFFPQRMTNVNYFDALGSSGSGGRTSLVLNPAQYRSDPTADPAKTTNTVRGYDGLDLRLFYSGDGVQAGNNSPSQALAPTMTDVSGTQRGRTVSFSVRATGDPSAGVQEVWVTWTSGPDGTGHGEWQPIDLVQDSLDSTLWTGTLVLPDGVQQSAVRFLVQAANGAGAVGLDAGEGDGYHVTSSPGTDTGQVQLSVPDNPTADDLGVTAKVVDAEGSPLPGRAVRFRLLQDGLTLSDTVAVAGADGVVTMLLQDGVVPPPGDLEVVADLLPIDGSTEPVDTASQVLTIGGDTLTVAPGGLATRAGTTYGSGATATVLDARGMPRSGVAVTFTLPTPSSGAPASATFPGGGRTATVVTNTQGVAVSPKPTAGTTVGTFAMTVTAPRTTATTLPMAAQYFVPKLGKPLDDGVTLTTTTKTVALTFSLLQANGTKLDDSTAASLVAQRRLEITSRRIGTTTVRTRNDLVSYDRRARVFKATLTGSQFGWVRRTAYVMTVHVLATPAGQSVDLGGRSFGVVIR